MSIEALKESYAKFEEVHPLHPLFQLKGSSATDLLKHAVRCIIDLYNDILPEDLRHDHKEPWITLMEFYENTHLCHPSTLAKLFKTDKLFFELCGMRKGQKLYIREQAALEYMSKSESIKLKKRALKILLDKERKEKPCLTMNEHGATTLPKLLIT